jgi:hypothetical protein
MDMFDIENVSWMKKTAKRTVAERCQTSNHPTKNHKGTQPRQVVNLHLPGTHFGKLSIGRRFYTRA